MFKRFLGGNNPVGSFGQVLNDPDLLWLSNASITDTRFLKVAVAGDLSNWFQCMRAQDMTQHGNVLIKKNVSNQL